MTQPRDPVPGVPVPRDSVPPASNPNQGPNLDPSSDPAGPAGEPAAVPDAARAALSRMRAAARAAAPAAAASRAASRPGRRPARARRTPGGFSGPGPDARDPQSLSSAWTELVHGSGWRTALDGAGVHALWPQIVGSVNAEHATPESFDPDTGALLVRTSSTAWAEQLRGMLPMLRTALDAHLGTGVVRDVQIVGPAAPRTRGRLRVKGRGPRDTYG